MTNAAAGEKAAVRGPGRPRSEQAQRAILESTLVMIGESGLAGLSIEAVAARAGVGKATIYRRWESKDELILAALGTMTPPGSPPDTGSFEGDLVALSQAQVARLSGSVLPMVAPRALAEAMSDAELHARVVECMVLPIRAVIAELVRRAIERGEFAPDTQVDRAVDMIHGAVIYRIMLSRGDLQAQKRLVPEIARTVGDGLRPRA